MSALGACGASPLPAPVTATDSPSAAASDGVGVNGASADATGVPRDQGDGASGSSFQKMMNQAQAGESRSIGGEPAAAAPTAGAVAVDALAADVARVAAAAAASAIAAASATAAASPGPNVQLLQFGGQAAGATNTSAAPQPATTPAKQAISDSDADAVPQDDSLVLVLASLAQLGITLLPATPMAAATANGGASLAVAVEGAAAQLAGALPRQTSVVDGLAARLRPAAASPLPAAANGEATGTAVPASLLQLNPSAGNITIRDLLDGSGGDVASRVRDPAETAAASRPIDGAGVLASAANDTPRTADAVARTISVPVQHPRWAAAVATEIRWFAEQGVQSATLRLNPEHMGPVDVRLSLNDSQVTVNFSAASAETRAALEQSLPRLREMLAGAGLSLGEAQVQQQMRQGSQNGANSVGGTADTDVRDSLVRVPQQLGLVDEYA